MSRVEIKLSKDEAKQLREMSEEKQEEFYANAEKVRTHLGLKSIALTTLLIECLEDLQKFNMERGKLKITGKAFRIQLHKYMNEVYKNIEGNSVFSSDYLLELTEKINKLIEE